MATVSKQSLTKTAGIIHPQKLFVGAEGTLGLVTEMTLRLLPLPKRRGICMVYFPSVFACGDAVGGILGMAPTACEIMDSRFLALVRSHYSQVETMLPPQTDTAILVEFEGRTTPPRREVPRLWPSTCRGGRPTNGASREQAETNVLWQSASRRWLWRKGLRAEKALPFIEDVTVHPTEVPGYIISCRSCSTATTSKRSWWATWATATSILGRCWTRRTSGTCGSWTRCWRRSPVRALGSRHVSGEHGDGLARTSTYAGYTDPRSTVFSSDVKAAFDPQGILNPGKKIGPQQDSVAPQGDNVRFPASYRTSAADTLLNFSLGSTRPRSSVPWLRQLQEHVETTMCPIYKAHRD